MIDLESIRQRAHDDAGFNAALATYGDVGEDVGAMFEAVTGVTMDLRPS